MTNSPPMVIAGLREAGTVCRRCQQEIHEGDQTTACPKCGGIHHWNCWADGNHCAAYECAPANRFAPETAGSLLRVSDLELSQAVPLPSRRPVAGWNPPAEQSATPPKPKWSRLAISSLVIAVLGIPLFGLITGLVAIVIGCVALVGHSRQWRGAGLAVAGIVLGVIDVAGWSVGLGLLMEGSQVRMTSLEDFDADPKALNELPSPINRAMKSNVLIQTMADLGNWGGSGMGSGVIVHIQDQIAWIVTNRHVIDPRFADDGFARGKGLPTGMRLSVKSIGQPLTPGKLVWVAPHGIDLALITMPVSSNELKAAVWEAEPKTVVGNHVFAIGNPHGLGWTYTPGGISQLRLQTKGPLEIRVIQTNAAINSGNSGGGLYDHEGRLVGINTWTQDKRYAEGLSFSISFHTLLPLLPADFQLPSHQLETDAP